MAGSGRYGSGPRAIFYDQSLLQSHLCGVIRDTYDKGNRSDNQAIVWRKVCGSCEQNRECLTFRSPREASIKMGLCQVIRAMRIFGLFHRRKGTSILTPSFAYSLVICVILWTNFFVYFYNYNDTWAFGSRLFWRITMHLWFGQVSLVFTMYMLQVSPAWPDFMDKWGNFAFNNHCMTAREIRRSGNIALVCTVLAVMISIMVAVAVSLMELEEVTPAQKFILECLGLSASNIFGRMVVRVYPCTYFFVWVLPTAFYYSVCSGIQFNFQRLSERLRSALSKPFARTLTTELGMVKDSHQHLCRLVKDLDEIFTVSTFAVYITCIPLMCMAIYNLAFNAHQGMSQIVAVAIAQLAIVLGQLGVITCSASNITTAAKSPLDDLFDFCFGPAVKNVTTVAFQISLLIQRLTKCHIGLTAWGLFNLNKQTIFTITTMIVTYMFVLFKLGISLEIGHEHHSDNATAH